MQTVTSNALDEYIELKKIHTSDKNIVYRALSKKKGTPVILKTLRSETPKTEYIEDLKHEFTILQHLKGVKGVNQSYDFLTQPNLILVEEDIGGISLKGYLETKSLSLQEFLHIAIQITEILTEIHAHHVIHKDINPSNLIYKPETGEVRIIDFSLASQLNEETQEEISPHLLEGTLAYMAPERTGRMNRPSDYRCDFYSLGVTFYELLTKKLPFESHDPLEIIHDHIAKLPPHISNIPESLDLLIGKLMAKNPDDRYSNALGIKADLLKCQEGKKFELGQEDVLDKFHISHKLYGRDQQIKEILQSYLKVSQGATELLLISGYSGIGKTSLVREVHRPMTQDRGIFISGKFDQLQRNVAYHAFVQAFGSLIHQLLSEPEQKLALIRQEIIEALGVNSQVIIEVIPDLELLIGKQPPVPILASQQAQNRFIYTFQNFLNVFAKAEHPLVIFLDDLQWADYGSLNLLEMIFADTSLQYLFVIGAYRDNEVSREHPLMLTLGDFQQKKIPISTIVLKPLQQSDLLNLLADSFISRIFETESLTEFIHKKTLGNPFFINEFLKLLKRENILFFNYKKLAWDADLEKIKALGITDNVVDLMIQNIQRLSVNAQELLKLAACIGHTFDLKTLSIVSEQETKQIAEHLWDPLQKGLIAGVNYQNIDLGKEIPNIEYQSYKFVHDRIQQAAYSLIPETTRQQKNLIIGRSLLKDWKKHPNAAELPSIMNHFMMCLKVTEPQEKLDLATYFLKVGLAAKESIAYETAYYYLKAGIDIQEPLDWNLNYVLLFQLYSEFTETEYLIGKIEEAKEHYDRLIILSKNRENKVKIYGLLSTMYAHLGYHKDAIHYSLAILQLFNVKINEKISRVNILTEFAKLKFDLRFRSISNLDKQIGKMTSQEQLIITKTMISIFNIAYQSNKTLMAFLAIRLFRIYLKHGYSNYTPAILALNSIIYINLNKIDAAFELIDLSKKIELLVDEKSKQIREFVYASVVHHFKYPISTSTDLYLKSYKDCLETGDLTYATYALVFIALNEFSLSKPLKEVLPKVNLATEFSRRVKNDDWALVSESGAKTIEYLLGISQYDVDSVNQLFHYPISQDLSVKGSVMTLAALLSFLANDTLKSLEIFEHWYDKLKKFNQSIYRYAWNITFLSACISDHFDNASSDKQKKYIRMIKEIETNLSLWNEHCPANYLHLLQWVRAEEEKISKNELKSLNFYDQAIEAAKVNKYDNFVAIINERVGKYYLQLNKLKLAQGYLVEAYHYYQRWGATEKLRQLEQAYPQWFLEHETMVTNVSYSTKLENLDLLSISKATQAISEEMVLDRLLTRIVQIVLENAAAERVVILQGQPLHIIAEGTLEKINVHEASEPTSNDLALSIPAYVLRTKQAVVLHDATNQPEQFKQDPYLTKNQIKSVLCAPISYQSKIMGVLYLENNLVTHAFTQDRLKVLSILSSQAAISLENSRHFERMNQLYHSTERFVPKPFLELLHKKISRTLLLEMVSNRMSQCYLAICAISQRLCRIRPPKMPSKSSIAT